MSTIGTSALAAFALTTATAAAADGAPALAQPSSEIVEIDGERYFAPLDGTETASVTARASGKDWLPPRPSDRLSFEVNAGYTIYRAAGRDAQPGAEVGLGAAWRWTKIVGLSGRVRAGLGLGALPDQSVNAATVLIGVDVGPHVHVPLVAALALHLEALAGYNIGYATGADGFHGPSLGGAAALEMTFSKWLVFGLRFEGRSGFATPTNATSALGGFTVRVPFLR